MKTLINKIKSNLFIFITFIVGIVLRFYFAMLSTPDIAQHDVVIKSGHMDYAIYIYKHMSLPKTNEWQFYHPPFNAIMQALAMKVVFFITDIRYIKTLYKHTHFLQAIWTIVALIFMYKILKELEAPKKIKKIAFAILSVYPGLIFMATQYSNDPPAFMFFFMSIYYAIMWSKNAPSGKSIRYIILLAISIGLGMLTRISVGLVALIIAPMMLIILSRHRSKKVFVELLIFAIIVFPLGLSYAIRNLMLFGQSLSYVPKTVAEILQVDGHSIVERVLSFPFTRLFNSDFGIYHDFMEYNIWIDLIKTSTFDEVCYEYTAYHPLLLALYILNIIFWLMALVSTIYTIFNIKKIKCNRNLIYISLLLTFIAIVSYIYFNMTHSASCTSSYRYVSYITFAQAVLISNFIYMIKHRGHHEKVY